MSRPQYSLLHELSDQPVLGVSLGNVSLLRLDQTGGPAPGNKAYKLKHYLSLASKQGVSRLVSFGGAWSNHLHALAAIGRDHGIETVGIVRGEETETLSAMLSDARRWGMQILRVSRDEYRRRNEAAYQRQVTDYLAPCLLIPEGGASIIGALGCGNIADSIRLVAPVIRHIILPVGTGTTLAGIAAKLDDSYEVIGVSALRGAEDLGERVQSMLDGLNVQCHARWRILHGFHCGGFARTDEQLREFILDFERIHRIELEPVYTGKMLYAIHQLHLQGVWRAGTPVLGVHTGGLQGRRGFPWLT